jgi:hypothetical protein
MCSDSLDRRKATVDEAAIEQSLWDALLHSDDVRFDWTDPSLSLAETMSTVQENPEGAISYPWNPADPNSEVFFDNLEARSQAELQGWDEAEFSNRAQTFLTNLDQLWAATDTQTSLAQRFGSRIPQALLAAITRNAHQMASQAVSLADQLVQSVQDLIPGMAPDDLYVLARPLAYAMRDGKAESGVDSVLAKVRPLEWEQLNEMEQARLSLAIARCALAELDKAD